MRPSARLLWLALGGLLFAIVCVAVPALPVEAATLPLAGLVLAVLIDLAVSLRGGAVQLEAIQPNDVFTGEAAKFHLRLSSRSPLLLSLFVEGRVQTQDGLQAPEVFSFVAQDDALVCDLPLKGVKRGTWMIERLWLKWSSRLGLIEFVPSHRIDHAVAVVPNIRPITSGEIDLKLRSALFGMKETVWRGEGSEFHQMTEYVAGMDPRSIDWKHSARHQKMLAKEMRAERNHQVVMAVDNGQLMRQEIDGLAMIDHMINSALALTWACLQSGDLVGLLGFDARPRHYAPPAPGQKTFALMRRQMADLEYSSVATNHTLALSHLQQKLQKRSLIVVLSDFADPLSAELLLDHMTILNRHHVVIFVSLRDPVLEEVAMGKTSSMDGVAKAVSAAEMLKERRSVLDQMSAMGVYVIETYPGQMTPRLLSTYLDIKAREVI
ncbi:DUF58 domain-containing protein [Pseudahrensia aquimaris]|uniref:DUF58 domain-containing protein n=1 Tax=Pseudahrensia aquimaris TaxID=744461 RepID=A0ABW3FE84_9HYPH